MHVWPSCCRWARGTVLRQETGNTETRAVTFASFCGYFICCARAKSLSLAGNLKYIKKRANKTAYQDFVGVELRLVEEHFAASDLRP
jgi:hypothetical protein